MQFNKQHAVMLVRRYIDMSVHSNKVQFYIYMQRSWHLTKRYSVSKKLDTQQI